MSVSIELRRFPGGPVAGESELQAAQHKVAAALGSIRRLGVAFSGGVDSTVLLALAARALGPADVLAILAVSASLAADERTAAHQIARIVGTPLVEISTRELDRPQYRANRADRCYFCKDELFTRIDEQVLREHRLDAVAYGENADDTRRIDRPGARAATDHRVLRPLAAAGLTKDEVRRIARALRLPNADKPAAPCLASRIPHSQEVTVTKLGQIDRAERALRELGFTDLRVRHHGAHARIELASDDVPAAVQEPLRSTIIGAVTRCGFTEVTIDPAGIRSGAFTLAALQAGDR